MDESDNDGTANTRYDDTWRTKKIEDFCEVLTGGTPSTKKPEYWNGTIKWMSSGEIHNKQIIDTIKKITDAGVQNSNARILPKNSIMLALNGQGKTKGTVAILKTSATCNQSLACIIPDRQFGYYSYIYYNLQSRYWEIRRYAGVRGRDGLNLRIVRNLEIPLPPLPEQKKIAEILMTLDSAIRKAEEAISKTERLKLGLMQKLLTGGIGHTEFKETKIGRIPEEWDVVTIGDITTSHKQGYYTSQKYEDNGIKLVRITDLLNPGISYNTMPTIKLNNKIYEDFKIKKGDFLIARSGAIGRFGIVEEQIPCVFGSYIIRFNFDAIRVSNYYIGHSFNSFQVTSQLSKITQGATNKNINARNIKKIIIGLPDMNEQEQIVVILNTIDQKSEYEHQRKVKLERIKKGLMNNLLTGKKRVKLEDNT